MTQEFYSNGKLLISGEYAILDGALSLAIPTKYGQKMEVSDNLTEQIIWKSLDEKNDVWFEGCFDLKLNQMGNSSDQETTDTLIRILKSAQNLNANFLKDLKGCTVETRLDFPRNWGLGSSSTLINNIAQWAKVDAFQLLWNSFQGSGYDIACAKHNYPISYQLLRGQPIIQKIDFNPSFKDQLFFVHLNQKMNSRDAINAYKKRQIDLSSLTAQISQITERMTQCEKLDEFEDLMTEHEAEMGKALGITPIQEKLFSDYFGKVKSLGAWGGDFILATGNSKTYEYFKDRGFSTILQYAEMEL